LTESLTAELAYTLIGFGLGVLVCYIILVRNLVAVLRTNGGGGAQTPPWLVRFVSGLLRRRIQWLQDTLDLLQDDDRQLSRRRDE